MSVETGAVLGEATRVGGCLEEQMAARRWLPYFDDRRQDLFGGPAPLTTSELL